MIGVCHSILRHSALPSFGRLSGKKGFYLFLQRQGIETDFFVYIGKAQFPYTMKKPFRFWLPIRVDIRNRKSTPRISDSGESAILPWVVKFLQLSLKGNSPSPKWNISAPSIERRRVRVVSTPGGGYSSPIFSLHRRPFKSALLFIYIFIKQNHAMSKNIH